MLPTSRSLSASLNTCRKFPALSWIFVAALSLALVPPPGARASGTTWHVSPNSAGACTQADPNCSTVQAAVGAASAGDAIQVAVGTYKENVSINKDLTVSGAGAGQTIVDGTQSDRVFDIESATAVIAVSLSGMTITNGKTGGPGGGIFSNATLTVTNVTVSGNSSVGNAGGGICNVGDGTLTVTNSIISNNSAATNGGGIFFQNSSVNITTSTVSGNSAVRSGGGLFNNGATMSITGSTVSNNSADTSGGICNVGSSGTLTVTNSTVSNNSASNGAGIGSSATLTVTSSTVSGNNAAAGGGGIWNTLGAGAVQLRSSVVAGNAAPSSPDLLGSFTSQGHTLVGASDGTNGFANGTNGDIIGTTSAPVDPQLRPLGNYGGPTQTQLPRPTSPAIDAGDDSVTGAPLGLTTDQRGLPRQVGAHVDIGAVEVNYAISAKAGNNQTTPINTAFATQLQVTFTESGNPVSGAAITFTAPAAGASGTFRGTGTNTATVNTDANGVAIAPVLTANGTAGGPFNVVAGLDAGSPSFNFSLTNAKGNQTITFGPLPDKTFGDPDFGVSATASSGLPVSFSAMTLSPCTVTGSTVHITGAGSCAISASQAGDSNYNAAAAVIRFLKIAPAPTSTSLSSSLNPSNVGQSVTFTVTVTSAAGTPPGGILGGVVFFDGGVMIPNSFVPLNSGQATFTTSSLSPGIHTITVEYTTTNPSFVGSKATLQGGQVVNGGVFSFSQATYTVNEGAGSVVITVRRDGNTSGPASVDYATDDGSTPSVAVPCASVTGVALERCDYTRAAGTLNFAAGDTQKTFAVLVNDDSYVEGTEITHLRLSDPVGDALGPQSTATLQINDDDTTPSSTNPADDAQFFVRRHYHDFLNREPDTTGLNFWTGGITSCGSNANCTAVKRVDTSAAFFLSIEFQQTGYLVERIYKVAFGDATGSSTFPNAHTLPVPVVRLNEFLRDMQEIGSTPAQVVVGVGDWQTQLENNKQAFALEFVTRQRFTNAFPASMSADAFVRQLNANAGGVLADADIAQLDNIFGGPSASSNDAAKRAQVLRSVAENPVLDAAEKNRAFVLMQFFGYLRRNPNDAQDTDYTGYDFWLQKLNQFNGNFVQAEMVKAFITSTEYRQRFGTP